jgi:hypothetical protein
MLRLNSHIDELSSRSVVNNSFSLLSLPFDEFFAGLFPVCCIVFTEEMSEVEGNWLDRESAVVLGEVWVFGWVPESVPESPMGTPKRKEEGRSCCRVEEDSIAEAVADTDTAARLAEGRNMEARQDSYRRAVTPVDYPLLGRGSVSQRWGTY